ncbi:MAG: N-acetyl-gamma-glutamyl-phosphate reductase [Clostridia bacterium]|nr:N-acetyl-gamma-glutamyl-phosphate reductase [Clostridia bacterium]
MIKVAILGATGYTGEELIRLLSMHPEAEIKMLVSHSTAGTPIDEIYGNFRNVCNLVCEELDIDKVAAECDVAFTALPHGASKEVIPALYKKGIKVIDLSGDFRYNDVKVYEEWYKDAHCAPELLDVKAYGLCELHREEVKKTQLVGNPGCFTTCSIMGMAPLAAAKVIDTKTIIVDAKSGVTGAGRGLGLAYHYSECDNTMMAYKVATHRHTSEIEQELSILAGEDIKLTFTPHLAPFKRGIYSTMYANLNKEISCEEIVEMYREFYKDEYFVRILDAGKIPQVKNVAGSNFVEIGITVDKRLNRVIVISTIDNLVKGASGQAIQNMNIMFGLDEKTGLEAPGYYL